MFHTQVNGPRSSAPSLSVRPEAGVRVQDAGPIRTVSLDRPSRKNAITALMYEAFTTALTEATSSDRIDVVLVSSSGGAFSTGSDFGAFLESDPGASDEALAHAAGVFVRTLASFPKPIVAAVGGLAVGMGTTILLHCDLVVAAPTAAFEFASTRCALEPEAGSSVLLAARVGLQRASEWLLFGERVDVETAYRFGLVNAIVHRGELAGAAYARAEALAKLPQGPVRETKRLLREPMRAAMGTAALR